MVGGQGSAVSHQLFTARLEARSDCDPIPDAFCRSRRPSLQPGKTRRARRGTAKQPAGLSLPKRKLRCCVFVFWPDCWFSAWPWAVRPKSLRPRGPTLCSTAALRSWSGTQYDLPPDVDVSIGTREARASLRATKLCPSPSRMGFQLPGDRLSHLDRQYQAGSFEHVRSDEGSRQTTFRSPDGPSGATRPPR